MNNAIFCGIAESLEIRMEPLDKLEIRSIKPTDNITPPCFSILVLDKSKITLYEEKRFASENKFDVVAYFSKETNRDEDIMEVCQVFDYLLTYPGMVSFQQIRVLMKLGILIYNGNEKRIKGASYDLIIDREYLKSGINVLEEDKILIEPLDYVVVGAKESVNIPRSLSENHQPALLHHSLFF